jgi:hypothetical protein
MTTSTINPTRQSTTIDSYEKGQLFERYIIDLFNQNSFELRNWRKSERHKDKMLLQDCANPDLELVFGRYNKYRFAVECKWREKFIERKITWASKDQISSYLDFENRCRIPVFIAIGIGGKPSRPEKLFVTPLRNIEMFSEVYEADLIPYKRKPTSKFFYDTVQLKLF